MITQAGRAVATLVVATLLAGTVGAASPAWIRVRPGDTLWGLATEHHTTVAHLRRLNHLRSDLLPAGRRLMLPGVWPGRRAGPRWDWAAGAPAGVARRAERDRALLAARTEPAAWRVRLLVMRTARRYGVDPALALAVADDESGFQQRVVSPVDAVGVMQVLPSTASALSAQLGRRLDVLRTRDNVLAGVLLLRQLVGQTGTARRALMGYYQGLGSLARQGLLPQTRAYVRTVGALRARYRAAGWGWRA